MNGVIWQRTRVSPDGTHHVVDECPVYKARFLTALSFHEPGLAAVRDARGAWHIDVRGAPAYPHVFVRAFGFYENLAAVRDARGWFHIAPDGAPAYSDIYEWCGNFQGGRAIVRSAGKYMHIFPDGRPLYRRRFVYAGDFRERRAVVRMKNGLCAHIGEDGKFAHPRRYHDLDVYHKGFARARDDDGWMHINIGGEPAYDERFLCVEPFYNERALAKTRGGDIVVIDECGRTIDTVMRTTASEDDGLFQSLSADMTGYWKTYLLSAAANLGAADKFPIADNDAGAILNLPCGNARVFLEALSELNIVRRCGDSWILTAKGELMRVAHPYSLHHAAMAWAAQSEDGANVWLRALRDEAKEDMFSAIAGDAKKTAAIQRMLSVYAAHDYASLPDMLSKDTRRLIDAGGGDGTTARLIADVRGDMNIVVLDRPEALRLFAASGRKNTGRGKISKCARNIFSPWNIAGDAVLLARVLHDWDDERALLILRRARAVLPQGGKLFIAEMLKTNGTGGLCSAHLLTVGGGRERTRAEYRGLMTIANFRFLDVRALNGGLCLMTGDAS